MKKLTILISLVISTHAFSSAKVCVEGDKIKVYSNLIFYGSKASESGKACAQEIYQMFNAPKAEITVGGKKLKVEFDVSYQIESEQDVYSSVNINQRVENNYIRIEDGAKNEPNGRSNHFLSANCGFYSTKDNLGKSTTCAHEFAHGLGLNHYNEKKTGYGSNGNLIGKGKPGIMAARGFLVDKQYQYDKNAQPGGKGGTINPENRIVRVEDIQDLKLENLEFDSKGCAKLGMNAGMAYDAKGEVVTGKNWYIFDVIKYMTDYPNMKQPISCH